jgi:energy-coupling factor transporter ATP-binding protein EcfA2
MSARSLPKNPYPGLRPFRKDEWAIFFGREVMIDAVLDRLAEQQLVVVHGSSGCGKSSLIKAGVLPSLEQEHSLHGVPWRTAEMRPGGSPLWHLAEAIARLVEGLADGEEPPLETTRGVHRLLNLGEEALEAIQNKFGLGKEGNVCLLLDQFEELFRYAREIGREEAETLIDVLKAFEAGEDRAPPKGLHAIITMRSDHLGDCAAGRGACRWRRAAA